MTEQTLPRVQYHLTRRITVGALFVALSLLLPQLFHLTGIVQAGNVFLPMQIPVLLGGFVLGPVFGLIIGAVSPVLSFFMTGMPSLERLPFMILELAAYGLVSGLCYQTLKLYRIRLGTYISLLLAMLAGRLVYALSLVIAGNLFGIKGVGAGAAIAAVVTGAVGIVIQFAIIPPIIYALRKGGLLNGFIGTGEKKPD